MPSQANFSGCIEQIGEEIIVVRSLPTQFDGPRARTRMDEERFTFTGSFQPASQKTLDRLDEGMRNKGACEVYSPVKLFTVNTSAARVPDRLIVGGETYQVELVDDWWEIAGYYHAAVTKLGR